MQNNSATVTVPAALLSALLDSTANLADYVTDEGRDPDTGIMVARDTARDAVERMTAHVMSRR